MDAASHTSDIPDASQAIKDVRVENRSQTNYFRIFGETYKGHYRGALLGLIIGGVAAAAAATAICALAIGFSAAPVLIPAVAGIGALLGAESFSIIGSASASRSTALAEKHVRLSDPIHKGNDLSAYNDMLMSDGRGYHYEIPVNYGKTKLYNPKSGAVGAAICGLLGGLLGVAKELGPLTSAAEHIATSLKLSTAFHFLTPALAGIAPGFVAGAITLGIIGLSFGIERSLIKSIFNHTDAIMEGKIHLGKHGPDIGQQQFKNIESPIDIEAHRLRRQQEIADLSVAYNKKIFWGALKGRFRGFAGGVAAGSLVGAAAGIVAVGIACIAGPPGWAVATAIIGSFAAGGSLLGMEIFTESGTEAGAESTARALDEEFERNRILQSKGIVISPAPEKNDHPWMNIKALVLSTAVGAALGVVLTPVIGGSIVSMVAGKAAMDLGVKILASGIIGAATGATYGLTIDGFKAIARVSNWIYDKSYGGHAAPQLEPTREPVVTLSSSHQKIALEDISLLNERMNTGRKNFTETLSQQVPSVSITTTI